IEGAIDEMKSPLTALFSGRQMLYAQSIDGLGSLNSGADDVPLTATQVSARLRNETPLSKKIQPIKQDEIIFCVGADDKTVYALDYDYQYARIPLHQLNDHCMSYFDSGIKQMMQMKGKLPYIVFLLNDGSLIFAICYRDSTGFQFHAFPQKMADGIMLNMAVLRNTSTGNDALFGVVQHSNGQYSLESIESYTDFYTAEKGQDYFKSHVLLDMKQQIEQSFNPDTTFTYTGIVGENTKKKFLVNKKANLYAWKKQSETGEPVEQFVDREYIYTLEPNAPGTHKPFYQDDGRPIGTVLPTGNVYGYESLDNSDGTLSIGTTLSAIASNYSRVDYLREESSDIIYLTPEIKNGIKLIINDQEILCENCIYDEEGNFWAETNEEPETNIESSGYCTPKKTFDMPEYIGLPVQAFNGDDFIEKESEDVIARTITFKQPIYSAEFGLPYKAYSEFINIVDVNSAPYETIINSISACITYGTGIKLGTETALEKVGYSEYPYTQWQNKILPDESLRNVILNDRGVKNKRIVIECDFPFPANVTFITYDIKATGVK
ncbi:MAG: hypothetical protein J6R99_02005, partial [Alphaproteobacteria bacterium]|nr:hypothetical protein [Alphaproteobacteria bacterium]